MVEWKNWISLAVLWHPHVSMSCAWPPYTYKINKYNIKRQRPKINQDRVLIMVISLKGQQLKETLISSYVKAGVPGIHIGTTRDPLGSTLLLPHVLEALTTFKVGFYHPEHMVSISWSETAFVAFSGMAEFCLHNTETILKYTAKK